MPSRPSQAKLNAAVRKLKQAGRDLEHAGHRLQTTSRDAERQARRARSPLRMQPRTSARLSSSEWHFLEQVHEHVAADPMPREHDVFLSHAGVDLALARELYAALIQLDVDVWMDDFSIKLGKNIVREIDLGISRSRVGIVLVTEAVLAGRYWVEQEFSALLNSKDRVIPLLYGVNWEQLSSYSPLLTTKKGLRWEGQSVDEMAELVASVLDD